MATTISCRHCQKSFAFPSKLSGKKVRCPNPECGQVIRLPSRPSAPPSGPAKEAAERPPRIDVQQPMSMESEVRDSGLINNWIIKGVAVCLVGLAALSVWLLLGGQKVLTGFDVLGYHERNEGDTRMLVLVVKVQSEHLRSSQEELDKFNQKGDRSASAETLLQYRTGDYVIEDADGRKWSCEEILIGSGNNFLRSGGLSMNMGSSIQPGHESEFGVAFPVSHDDLRFPLTLQFQGNPMPVPNQAKDLGDGPVDIPEIQVPKIEIPEIQVPNISF